MNTLDNPKGLLAPQSVEEPAHSDAAPYWRCNFGFGPSVTREFVSTLKVMKRLQTSAASLTQAQRIAKGRKIAAGLRKALKEGRITHSKRS